jgi:hypothetical protein
MKITIKGTTASLDPNATSPDSEQSLQNYNNELTAAVLEEYPDAEIIHLNEDDSGSGIVVRADSNEEEEQAVLFVQRIGEQIYAQGNFWV